MGNEGFTFIQAEDAAFLRGLTLSLEFWVQESVLCRFKLTCRDVKIMNSMLFQEFSLTELDWVFDVGFPVVTSGLGIGFSKNFREG